MAGFGVTTDPWAFAETGINLVGATNGAKTGSAAQCPDSNGDVLAETVYDTGASYEAEYQVNPAKLVSFATLKPGKVVSGKVVTGITVARSNTDRLNIKISGENCPLADSLVEKYTIAGKFFTDTAGVLEPAYLTGGKDALRCGVVVSAGRVVASTVAITCQVAKGLSATGAQVFKGVYGCRMEASNDLVSSDTTPAGVADTVYGWAITASNTKGETNTGYPTATISAFKNLVRDS